MPPPLLNLFLIVWVLLQPVHPLQNITFELLEETPISFPLGKVTDFLEVDQEKTLKLVDSLRYSLLPQGHPHSSLFRITDGEGKIFATKPIDREAVCGFLEICILHLEVVVQSAMFQLFQRLRVDVEIMDINDNAPKFPSPSIALDISESVSVNSSFAIEGAIDRDIGRNSLQEYDIIRADDMFDLEVKQNLDGGSLVNLVVKKPLDREVRDFFKVFIMAKDGGVSRQSSLLMVNITVTDINDNAPRFSETNYITTVQEIVPLGHMVLKVTASDLDSEEHWRPFYRFSAIQAGEARKYFSVNPQTGEITVIAPLSNIQGRKMSFVVECVDGGAPPLVGQSLVEVFIQDTENSKPVINLNLLNDGSVSESFRTGTVVAHLATNDLDSGVNGNVRCTIQSDAFEMQGLGRNEYKVLLKRQVDREMEEELEGIITCEDEGSPPLNITEIFLMTVLDENDNTPTFSRELYEITIKENNDINKVILQVTAADNDTGDNGQVFYTITEGAKFGLNISEAGEISALAPLDREETSKIELMITAKDGGVPPLNASAKVVIHILDENDCDPAFSQSIYSFEIDENMSRGSEIGQIVAYDLDEGSNGEIFLNLDLMFQDINSFPISVSQNGQLKTTRVLDREAESHFEFVVMATDKGREQRTSTAKVYVDVTDVNDNYPELVFPVTTNNTILIPYFTDPFATVVSIEAFDGDTGNNGNLFYTLTSVDRLEDRLYMRDLEEDIDDPFNVDVTSGNLTLTRPLQLQDIGSYALEVMIQDQGTPFLSINATLIVDIYANNETIFALLTGMVNNDTANTTIVTALGCLTGIIVVAVVIIIFTMRVIDRERTLTRQRQLHVKVEPRDGDLKYEEEITEAGSKLRRTLSAAKIPGQIAQGWRFLSAWHLGSGDSNKLSTGQTWARNKGRKVSADSCNSVTSITDSGKGVSDDENPGNETSSLQGSQTDEQSGMAKDNQQEPLYSTIVRSKDKMDSMQSRRLLPLQDEISLPSDDAFVDYCSLDTIKEEPESPFVEAEFRFDQMISKDAQTLFGELDFNFEGISPKCSFADVPDFNSNISTRSSSFKEVSERKLQLPTRPSSFKDVSELKCRSQSAPTAFKDISQLKHYIPTQSTSHGSGPTQNQPTSRQSSFKEISETKNQPPSRKGSLKNAPDSTPERKDSLRVCGSGADRPIKGNPFKQPDHPVPKLRQTKKRHRNSVKETNTDSSKQNEVKSVDNSEEETLRRASVDCVTLQCGDSVIFDLDLQKVSDIFV